MDSPALLVLLSVAAVLLPLVFAWWLVARRMTPKRRAAGRPAVRRKAGVPERSPSRD